MTAPEVSARRFALSLLLGLGLGVCYGLLRPLRVKHRHLGDFLFLLAAGQVFLYQSFAVCRGDIRPGYWAGLFLGGLFWELTLGRLLRPVIFLLFRGFDKIFGFPFRLIGKIFEKTKSFYKNLFAYAKKSVTIKPTKKTGSRRPGKEGPHGRKKKKASPGVQAQQPADQGCGAVRNRTVYGGPAGFGQRDP